jgi:hypothetical protein
VLEVMQRTFATYITEQPEAVTLKEKLNEAEAALAGARNKMKLGYTDPKTGEGRDEWYLTARADMSGHGHKNEADATLAGDSRD